MAVRDFATRASLELIIYQYQYTSIIHSITRQIMSRTSDVHNIYVYKLRCCVESVHYSPPLFVSLYLFFLFVSGLGS